MSAGAPFVPQAGLKDRSSGPLYRQLTQLLRQTITGHDLPIGYELPTEAQLAQAYGVSLITVRHALRELEADGLIQKRAAKTAIVAATGPRLRPSQSLNSLADIIANVSDARLDIATWRAEHSSRARQVFGLQARRSCPCLRARLIVRGRPQASIAIYFPPALGIQLRRGDFNDVVVFRSVQRRLGIRYAGARVTVRAEVADARLARALECRPGAALLTNEMIFLSPEGTPLELTIARHRADLYSLSYDLRPESG